jgi:glycosyltransferase involved in cell wall biosynthesis
MMTDVSIIIPCYNAEAYVAEAVQSCLDQTYASIEIIVVDDGSTDGSVRALARFGARIVLKTGSNCGGNVARNRGFGLSSGKYIQFLDADDYLLPDKIDRQVRFLEQTGADAVYGDWRYRFHLSSTFSYLDRIQRSGAQADILESLLSHWWVAPGAILYRRAIVERVGGWDENLRAAQDKDFFTSMALANADIRYQPGCSFVYRKYGATTVSTSNMPRWFDQHCVSLEKSEGILRSSGRFVDKYRRAMAIGYSRALRHCFPITTERQFNALEKIDVLVTDFTAGDETVLFSLVQRLIGYYRAAIIFSWIRAVINRLKLVIKKTVLGRIIWLKYKTLKTIFWKMTAGHR